MKLMEPEGEKDVEKAAKAKSELTSIEQSIEQAEKYGWNQVLEMQKKKKVALLKTMDTELGSIKETRTVIGAQVNLAHTHESKCAALEAKEETAEAALSKHKEKAEERTRKEKERHENALKAIAEDCKRFTKH